MFNSRKRLSVIRFRALALKVRSDVVRLSFSQSLASLFPFVQQQKHADCQAHHGEQQKKSSSSHQRPMPLTPLSHALRQRWAFRADGPMFEKATQVFCEFLGGGVAVGLLLGNRLEYNSLQFRRNGDYYTQGDCQ